MIASLRAAAVTLPIVFVAPAIASGPIYDPHVLILTWPGGHQERLAATSESICRKAIRAMWLGFWRPAETEPTSATCVPGNLFAPGSEYITGFNAPGDRRR